MSCYMYKNNDDIDIQKEYKKGVKDGELYAKLCKVEKEIPEWLHKREKSVAINFANGMPDAYDCGFAEGASGCLY